MRYPLALLLLFCLLTNTSAPPVNNCDHVPSAMIDLDGNGIRARLTTGGDLWFDGNSGRYDVSEDANQPNLSSPSAVFAGGLWLAGRDPGGGLKVAVQQYGRSSGNFDYRAGPLDENGVAFEDCAQWDRFWKVTSAELRDYLSNFDPANPDISAIPGSFLAWPGAGNPFFTAENGFELPQADHGYAPFFDVNMDGVYDPLAGDYPLFCGDQAVWCVFNDAEVHNQSGTPTAILAEVQLLAYSFEASPGNPLRHTTFYDYKVINRAAENIFDFYASLWVDFDLGCFTDDVIGSIPENNLVYVHNDMGTDEPFCDFGIESFTTPGVVQIAQVVNASVPEDSPLLSSFSTIANAGVGAPPVGVTDPVNSVEFYNYMQGLWRDGSPITRGADGYQQSGAVTRYAFDGGALSDGTPWRACSENLGLRDLRGVISTGPYNLQPEEIATFTIAMTTVFNVDFPNTLCPDTSPIIAAANTIKGIYDGFCSPSGLVDTENPNLQSVDVTVFPNPAHDVITFEVPGDEQIAFVELYDVTGQLLTTVPALGNSLTLSLAEIVATPGVFLYRLRTNSGKVAINRVLLIR